MYATNLLPSLTGMIGFSASAADTAVSQFAALRDDLCHCQCFCIALLCASELQLRLNRDVAGYERRGCGAASRSVQTDSGVVDESQDRFDYWGPR